MVERPLNFSPAEMLAERRGARTQIRRPLRRQPPAGAVAQLYPDSITAHIFTPGHERPGGGAALLQSHWSEHCPFGRDGDRLWVREGWQVIRDGGTPDRDNDTDCTVKYTLDGDERTFNTGKQLIAASTRRKPAAHLPRWAARRVYEVLDVRVQRLHAITEAEAIAEGADPLAYKVPRALDAFRYFWEDSGHGPWSANPWVWVAHVRRLELVR